MGSPASSDRAESAVVRPAKANVKYSTNAGGGTSHGHGTVAVYYVGYTSVGGPRQAPETYGGFSTD